MTFEEMKALPEKEQEELFHKIKEIRSSKAKPVNFGGVYGAGPAKLADMLKMSLEDATKLHTTYWERNKAVKDFAASCRVQTINHKGKKQDWVFNPVSKFWLWLKDDKDIFSAVNQSTGSYVFDLWLKKVRAKGLKIKLQYHDEQMFQVYTKHKEAAERVLRQAMEEVNEELKLNVEIGISVDFGKRYSEIH